MDKNKKKLISEFANVISGFSSDDIIKFFADKKYMTLKSFSESSDLELLKLYLESSLNIKVNLQTPELMTQCPDVFLTVIAVNESLSKIGLINREKYLQNASKDDIIIKITSKINNENDFIIQLSSVIDNRYDNNHQIDFLYFAYTSDESILSSIFDIKFNKAEHFKIEIYKSILKTFKNISFDKDLDEKINNILEVLNDVKI